MLMNGIKYSKIIMFFLFLWSVTSQVFAGNWDEMLWDQGVWDVSQALDSEGYIWTTSGDAEWIAQSTVYLDGNTALQSGVINHDEQSSIETTVSGVGTVSFYWKVSSETEKDFFKFYIDGVEMASISGEVDWQQRTFALSYGDHILRWTYSKDSSLVGGDDAGWLDDISTNPNIIAPIIFLLD